MRSRPAGLPRRGHRSPAPAAPAAGAGRRRVPTPRPTASRPAPTPGPGRSAPAGGRALSVYAGSACGQHGFGEGVAGGSAQRDPHVGQIGVDVEVAVARLVRAAAGGGDTGADQRDHQLARQRPGHRLRRRHHLGHRDRPHGVAYPDSRRRGQAEPAVGGVVQRPQVLRGVHRAVATGVGCSNAKPRPTTASPTSLTGMAPGTGHGHRSRSKRSAPVNSSMVVRQSTRGTPRHRVTVWV